MIVLTLAFDAFALVASCVACFISYRANRKIMRLYRP